MTLAAGLVVGALVACGYKGGLRLPDPAPVAAAPSAAPLFLAPAVVLA